MTTNTATLKTGHIGLNVSDLNRSKQFYQQAFGFDIMGESSEGDQHFAFLGKGDQLFVTLWQQSSGKFSRELPGLHHLAFQLDSMEDVIAAEKRLRDMTVKFLYDGVVPHREGASSGGIFFEDPDGIRLEIYAAAGAENFETQAHGPSCGLF